MSETLRVVTYNIHKGFPIHKASYQLMAIRNAIEELNADLVFLQEIRGKHTIDKKAREFHDQLEILADTLWPHTAYGKNAIYTHTHHGNAIMSRYPFKDYENLDISTNRFEKRGLLHGQIQVPHTDEGPIHVLCLHLNLFESGRLNQISKLIDRTNEEISSEEPLIIAGDFNDWRHRLDGKICEELGAESAHIDALGNPIRTYPSFFPFLPLDRIFYRNLVLKQSWRETGKPWVNLSDHLPLVADFTVM